MVVDPQDYPLLLEFLKGGGDDQLFRRRLAWKAFQHVASYDSAVAEWLWKQTSGISTSSADDGKQVNFISPPPPPPPHKKKKKHTHTHTKPHDNVHHPTP